MNIVITYVLVFYFIFLGVLLTIKGLVNHVDREFENDASSVFVGMLFILVIVVWWFT